KGGSRRDADPVEQRHDLAEDAAIRQRHDQGVGNGAAKGGARVPAWPHFDGSSGWPGCQTVGQGSPRSRTRQRIAAAVSRIVALPANSRAIAQPAELTPGPAVARIAKRDRIRSSSLR